mmetsp:Transcript_26849/g.63731  ORF Transcript_26849/g.63731 Transcript_26849/m.63731 type:complete len:287 (+) Transcript_26849:305-1165(+)
MCSKHRQPTRRRCARLHCPQGLRRGAEVPELEHAVGARSHEARRPREGLRAKSQAREGGTAAEGSLGCGHRAHSDRRLLVRRAEVKDPRAPPGTACGQQGLLGVTGDRLHVQAGAGGAEGLDGQLVHADLAVEVPHADAAGAHAARSEEQVASRSAVVEHSRFAAAAGVVEHTGAGHRLPGRCQLLLPLGSEATPEADGAVGSAGAKDARTMELVEEERVADLGREAVVGGDAGAGGLRRRPLGRDGVPRRQVETADRAGAATEAAQVVGSQHAVVVDGGEQRVKG